MLKTIKLAAVFIFLFPGIVFTKENANAEVLSIDKCLQEAYANSPALKVAESKKAGAFARGRTGGKPRHTWAARKVGRRFAGGEDPTIGTALPSWMPTHVFRRPAGPS